MGHSLTIQKRFPLPDDIGRLTLALPVCIIWLPGWLGYGGLAPVAVAILTAVVVTSTISKSPITIQTKSDQTAQLASCIAEMMTAGVIGAAFAPLVNGLGDLTAMAAAAGLWLMALAGGAIRGKLLRTLGLALVSGLVLVLLYILGEGLGWTLMEPHWATWRSWLGPSVVAGGVIGTAVSSDRSRSFTSPWILLGITTLVSAAAAVVLAFEWESSAPSLTFSMLPVLGLLACMAAAFSAVDLHGGKWMPSVGALLCLWFAGPGYIAVPYWWTTFLPGLVLGYCYISHERSWRTGVMVVPSVTVLLTCWGGLPNTPSDAAILGITGTLMFWILASRRVLGAQS